MNCVSLFTGAGGGELATQHLLGWETIAYNEMADYPVRVLRKRITEGNLHDAPVYHMPISEFNAKHAEGYRDRTDIITAGFPCQPFSGAGRGLADKDSQNQWPATRDTIRIIRPRYALLENVAGLIARHREYFGIILGDLAEMGYNARWGVLSAAASGAPYRRDRLWIAVASTSESRWEDGETTRERLTAFPWLHAPLASPADPINVCNYPCEGSANPEWLEWYMGWPIGWTGLDDAPHIESWMCGMSCGDWWVSDPADSDNPIPHVCTDIKKRKDRIFALGNGQVPAQLVTAWSLLT